MIVVCVGPEQDLDVREFESQLFDRLLNRLLISFIRAVNENIALRRNNEERAQGSGPHVVEIADNFVGRELRCLVLRRTHVARQNRPRRKFTPMDSDLGMVGGWRRRLCPARAHAPTHTWTQNGRRRDKSEKHDHDSAYPVVHGGLRNGKQDVILLHTFGAKRLMTRFPTGCD